MVSVSFQHPLETSDESERERETDNAEEKAAKVIRVGLWVLFRDLVLFRKRNFRIRLS